jgi:predicted MPP superfamily phosphohydrolase
VVLVVALTEIFARRYAPFGGGWWRPLVWAERVAGFTLMITLLASLAAQLAAPLVAALAGLFARPPAERQKLPEAPEAEPVLTRREAVTRAVSTSAAGFTSAAVLYGSLRERHDIELTEVPVGVQDLPPSLEGLTIVQITDLHAGIFTGRAELDHVVARVNRLRADLVVITGDILDNNPAHIPDAMRALGRLRGRLGVHAILGNHDLYTGGERVRRGLAAAGISCLVNRSVKVHTGDARRGSITLAGVNDVMAHRLEGEVEPDLVRALQGADREAPVVLLAHNPVFFEEASGLVALQLSGHTHGGQVNVAGVAGALLPFVAGRYVRDRATLYVSRGIGITGAPVRLAAAPEVTRVVLTGLRT